MLEVGIRSIVPTERWLQVSGHPSYQVSDLGRVWSEKSGRILTGKVGARGYREMKLDGHTLRVHRLVLTAFAGPCPPGQEACHDNDVPDDNRLANLRWDTHAANMADRARAPKRCPRGHELVTPNLIPAQLRNGQRACLACSRARSNVQRHPELDLFALADEHHARIVS